MNTRRRSLLFLTASVLASLTAQQRYYTFSELKGMEDTANNTHLFFRLYTFQKGDVPFSDYYENSIHHFDIQNSIDSVFLKEGQFNSTNIVRISDVEFWNNDPSTFIYSGEDVVVDPVAFIRRFDQTESSFSSLGEGRNLEIGKQNDSLVIASVPYLIKSVDGGYTWAVFYDSANYGQVVSISPYNDDVIFFYQNGMGLVKTTDGGKMLNPVDTSQTGVPAMYYDSDSLHIYNASQRTLRVSDNRGNAFSWHERYSSFNPIYISVDYSQTGKLFLADGKQIYISTDYGLTFNEFKTMGRKIIGIYKKPNSDKLYAAARHQLYEITADTVRVIKNLPLDSKMFSYYPLHVGDQWVYNYLSCVFDPEPCVQYKLVRKVVGDTVMPNKKKYFIIQGNVPPNSTIFERIDSSEGLVLQYDMYNRFPDEEQIAADFFAEPGDTIAGSEFGGLRTIYKEDGVFSKWGLVKTKRVYNEWESLFGHRYSLTEGIGIDTVSFGFDFGYAYIGLQGAIINGIVYGDTTILGVEEEDFFPTKFSLSQNYPNPFNPSTTLEYQLPKRAHVTIKIFDVIGREVASLVNEERDAGTFKAIWNASKFSSGMYFARMVAGSFSITKKLLLLK